MNEILIVSVDPRQSEKIFLTRSLSKVKEETCKVNDSIQLFGFGF